MASVLSDVARISDLSFPEDVIARVAARRGGLHPYERVDPSRSALIVVDMQNAFLAANSPISLQTARDIVPTVNRLAAALRRTGGKVVWIVSTYGPKAHDHWPILLGDVFAGEAADSLRAQLTEGAEGHALWPSLAVDPHDSIVSKNRSSAFLGSNGALQRLLVESSIETVMIGGTMTSVCCESTAREAAMLDYRTIFVADASGGRSEQEDLACFCTFIQSFGDVALSDDVIGRLEAGAARVTARTAAPAATPTR
jgi:ureidoacrylate peracid hydrolase